MGMIRRTATGKYYCDGRECGYPLAWFELGPDEGAEGEWVCLDCNASMYAGPPVPAEGRATATAPAASTGTQVVQTVNPGENSAEAVHDFARQAEQTVPEGR